MKNVLLNRNDFRNGVFIRDNHKCVICDLPAIDAHHIIERRLFNDGGYYLDNGVSLCEKHHIEAEMTTLSTNDIRKSSNITNIILPEHFYVDANYDKWGNEILPNGQRLVGELFNNESVQKILKQGNVLSLFTDYVKYPRTLHFSWSDGITSDDKVLHDLKHFEKKHIVITEKMDGENTSMYPHYIHARSINSDNHASRNWVKGLWSKMGYNIPKGWRLCGENLFAKHSIHYTKENGNELKSFFYMFSIWDESNVCLSWKETKEYAELLSLELVPVIYEGIWDINIINNINVNNIEGYVIRIADEFHYSNFRNCIGKYVRKDHIQTSKHWTQEQIIRNEKIT